MASLRTSSLRAASTKTAKAPRASVRPAAVSQQAAAASLAAATALVAAAPAHATNLIASVASAAEGYPFVPPEWAPSVFVPLTGLVVPAIAMASLFVYIEKEAPAK